jgi:hypothetical protein
LAGVSVWVEPRDLSSRKAKVSRAAQERDTVVRDMEPIDPANWTSPIRHNR